MAHRARKESSSAFENAQHKVWVNPYTGAEDTASFWDLFYGTEGELQTDLKCFLAPTFDAKAASSITHGMDFDGKPEGSAFPETLAGIH